MSDLFSLWVSLLSEGIVLGFMLGFISWGIGFGIYGIIRLFKMV
jgi:hypothetical protein